MTRQMDTAEIPRLSIAVMTASLEKYGGAERYLVECVRRWQARHDVTLYATAFDEAMLGEHGVADTVGRVRLTGLFDGEHATLLNAVLLPRIWRGEIARHDIYNPHVWPMHLVDLHPMLWVAHEPFRALHDLRFEHSLEGSPLAGRRSIHVYPKFSYDDLDATRYEAVLGAIDAVDRAVAPDRIVANSRQTARAVAAVYDRPVDDVVYPGVEVADFPDLPTDPNLFATIGQLWSHKRIQLLIEAIALTDETQLLVIGSGPERERLEAMAERLGVADRVFFLCGLTNRELALVLARTCAFLFAAIREPFGIVVLEAMAAGKPVIAVQGGGYAEICTTASAFLVPPYPAAFAQQMAFLQDHPERARAMGEAGRAIARRYTWDRTAGELEALLLEAWRVRAPAVKPDPGAAGAVPMVGIQYYLWYAEGYASEHWNDNREFGHVRDRPLLGFYASHRGETINDHLDRFEAMGLDFAILNLHVDDHGLNMRELTAIRHVLDIAAQRASPLRFALQIAPYAQSPQVIAAVVDMIAAAFAERSNYLHFDGAPVLFWFWTSAHDGDAELFDALAGPACRFVNLATALRLARGADEAKHTFGLFAAMAPYSPLELAAPDRRPAVWRAAVDAANAAGMTYRMATVSPGYDDSALDDPRRAGNPYRVVPRHGGATYRETMDFVEALDPAPHFVLVSTFNEMHENTHIEPSQDNGSLYVDMTRDFVSRLKRRHDRGET